MTLIMSSILGVVGNASFLRIAGRSTVSDFIAFVSNIAVVGMNQ